MDSQENINGIILIYGIPGSGKTYFSNNLIPIFSCLKACFNIYLEIDIIEGFFLKHSLDEGKMIERFDEIFKQIIMNRQNFDLNDFVNALEFSMQANNSKKQEEIKKTEKESLIFDNKIWKYSRDFTLKICEKIIENLEKTKKNYIILVDDNFILTSMRKKYYQLCGKFI